MWIGLGILIAFFALAGLLLWRRLPGGKVDTSLGSDINEGGPQI